MQLPGINHSREYEIYGGFYSLKVRHQSKTDSTQTLTKSCITTYICSVDASFTSKTPESVASKARTMDYLGLVGHQH